MGREMKTQVIKFIKELREQKLKQKGRLFVLVRMASRVVGRLVTLKLNNDYPLQMPFKVTDGCEVVYLLAPRLDMD